MVQRMNLYDRPTGPIIAPLKHISPTTHEDLRACFMRTAFQNDQRFLDIRPISTLATLGSISHRLLEDASRGEFNTIAEDALLKEAIHNRWLELVQTEVQSLQNKAFGVIPLPQQWPKYALRMVAACTAAFRIANQRKNKYTRDEALLTKKIKAEVWYEGCNGKLAGRIDLIRYTSSGIELVDYKSGLVMQKSEADGDTQQLKEQYERQMLLYASLVHENEGQWPAMITVESLIDGPHEVAYTPEASEETVKEALLLLDTYNRKVASGEIRGIPNEDYCRWCSFKALCRDYLDAANKSWTAPSTTVLGRVASVHADLQPFLTLEIIGGDYYKEVINIRGIPVDIILMIEKIGSCLLSFGNLRQTLGAKDLVFIWNSVLWRWED